MSNWYNRATGTVMRNRSTRVALFVTCFLIVFAFGICAQASKWPEVVPMHKGYHFTNARTSEIDLSVLGAKGEPLYRMECHTFEYEKDPGFDYSGDFECRLKSLYSDDAYSTLLTEEPQQTRDWQSRGRFLAEEIEGKCADYPEFGRVRHFRLRGIKITLTISDVVFRAHSEKALARKEGSLLKSFRFDVKVEVDSKATSAISEPIPYQYPPRRQPGTEDMSLDCERSAMKASPDPVMHFGAPGRR